MKEFSKLVASAISALWLATPAMPQSDELSEGECVGLLYMLMAAPLFEIDTEPANYVLAADDGCLFEDMQLRLSEPEGFVLQFASFDVQAEGIRQFHQQFAIPERVRIQALDFYPMLNNLGVHPLVRYTTNARLRWNVVDMDILLTHDPDAKSTELERFHFNFPGDNEVTLSARFSGVDLSNEETLEASAGTARLQELHFRLTTHGIFETYALTALAGPALAQSTDPEADLSLVLFKWLDQIEKWPDDKFPPETKDAIERFLFDLPNPAGTIEIDIVYYGGFGMAEAMALGQARFDNLEEIIWPDFRVDMSYERTGIDP